MKFKIGVLILIVGIMMSHAVKSEIRVSQYVDPMDLAVVTKSECEMVGFDEEGPWYLCTIDLDHNGVTSTITKEFPVPVVPGNWIHMAEE